MSSFGHRFGVMVLALVGWFVTGCAVPMQRYARLSGGWVGAADVEHQPDVDSNTFPGPSLGLSLGAQLGAGWRAEAEVSYRQHPFGDFTIGDQVVGGDGELFAYGAMANAFFDLELQSPAVRRRWWPYLGLGVGVARAGYDIDSFGGSFVDDCDDVLAVQLLAGIGVDLDGRWGMSLGYRALKTEDPVLTDELGRRFDAEYFSQAIELSAVLRF